MTKAERIEKLKQLLIKGSNLRISSKTYKVFGYQYNYYAECYGDLNAYYFGKHEVTEKLVSKELDNRPGIIKEKTLYVCVQILQVQLKLQVRLLMLIT